ncbi:hypothetical protein ABZX75_29405 [Streptomyces sp. NPDC003038]|uniref:hypothetical protein n=1 Tax=unclassified Streptomyces TaxID=2593676 RepID=UPI0033A21D98
MKLKPYTLGALLLTLLALLAPSPATALADAGTSPRAASGAAARHQHTAAQIALFLAGFYGTRGPSAYDREHRVSQVLKDRQKAYPETDVLLCAQNTPQATVIGPITVAPAAGVGWATVTTHWGSGAIDTFTAYVRLDSRPIRLDDVICAG